MALIGIEITPAASLTLTNFHYIIKLNFKTFASGVAAAASHRHFFAVITLTAAAPSKTVTVAPDKPA